MNWRLILILALTGIIAGFVTLYVPTVKMEQFVWLIVLVASAFVIQRYAAGKYFLNGFILGILDFIIAGIIHVCFFNVYLQHHKYMTIVLTGKDQTLDPRTALFIIELVKGIFIAIMAGGFAFVLGKGIKKAFNNR